jgi:tRNA pseudouridine55 synthase
MNAPRRAPTRRVDGVLLLDKPIGLSSNAALQQAKHLYRAAKAGHTGTLDPLASGLLPICFGEATKFAHMLLDADKTYVATIRLGVTTTTGDAEGSVVLERPITASQVELESLLPRFVGRVAQRPPAYAALKYQGRKYYEYARAGIEIPRAEREIMIAELTLDAWSPPEARLTVRCGKGTYVRVLAEDLGEALGCGAHLAALRRTATGGFDLGAAVTLDALTSLADDARDRRLRPADVLVVALPRLDLAPAEAVGFRDGRVITRAHLADGAYRTYADGWFVGIAHAAQGRVRPRRLVAAPAADYAASGPIESLES